MISNTYKQEIKLTELYREAVYSAIREVKGTNKEVGVKLGLEETRVSRVRNFKGNLTDETLLRVGKDLGVPPSGVEWQVARTKIYRSIEEMIIAAKSHQASFALVDSAGSGKTFSARHIAREYQNVFYVDCSQSKTPSRLVKNIARSLGVRHVGITDVILEELKYKLAVMETPVIILDEFGDINNESLKLVKELWNAVDGSCGWIAMGADGMKVRMERGLSRAQVGYAEIYSRFSDRILTISPSDPEEYAVFYKQTVYEIAIANGATAQEAKDLARRALADRRSLRYVKTDLRIRFKNKQSEKK